MNSKQLILVSLLFVFSSFAIAGSSVRTSKEGAAIDGYDPVAYFTAKRAVKGLPEIHHEWSGTKWHFSSRENLELFVASPEKYAPQYGGHCAYGIIYGYVSKKRYEPLFEIYEGKLYLFPGDASKRSWDNQASTFNLRRADENWIRLGKELESK